jgi:hypothetical protein
MYLFSRKTLAFYPANHIELYKAAGTLPDDVIEVADEIRNVFNFSAPAGKKRGVNGEGLPAWVDKSGEELVKDAEQHKEMLISEATHFINNKQWPGKAAIGRLKGDELVQYEKWLDYLDAIEAMDNEKIADQQWPTKPA